ncbi:traK protein [Escherichia coli]|uniref:traK protein n=1 Tax=Escherichia coli TaxID=562 RepID=UPI000F631707|nr:traK protein [Escherichia coli]EDT5719920.1 traK protein [Salmonella enterica subsp. enterica serovar Chester]EEB5205316.1 traK protein [Salmonella enterica]EFT7565453.1 traK protein [Salmonella enterica]EHC8092761.1 traK protein [Salmonella enterica]RRM87167.1 traK protein [Escherichia coli]
MPTITAKVSDELLAYIDRVSGGNRSEYLRRCLEAGPGDRESGLKIVADQLGDVNRKLDYLFDRASDADFGSLRDELKAITETLSSVKFPPAGQMMLHESLAIETLILLRSIAEPGKTKAAKAEVERNGYKVWEPKKER